MESIVDSSFLDKIDTGGNLDEDEQDEDEEERQRQMLEMLQNQLPEDLLDDSCTDDETDIDITQDQSQVSEDEQFYDKNQVDTENLNETNCSVNDDQEIDHIKLINGQEVNFCFHFFERATLFM